MQTTITAKLKLKPTPAQFAALRQTSLAYRDALNHVSRYAFAQGKTGNTRRLQTALYVQVSSTRNNRYYNRVIEGTPSKPCSLAY